MLTDSTGVGWALRIRHTFTWTDHTAAQVSPASLTHVRWTRTVDAHIGSCSNSRDREEESNTQAPCVPPMEQRCGFKSEVSFPSLRDGELQALHTNHSSQRSVLAIRLEKR